MLPLSSVVWFPIPEHDCWKSSEKSRKISTNISATPIPSQLDFSSGSSANSTTTWIQPQWRLQYHSAATTKFPKNKAWRSSINQACVFTLTQTLSHLDHLHLCIQSSHTLRSVSCYKESSLEDAKKQTHAGNRSAPYTPPLPMHTAKFLSYPNTKVRPIQKKNWSL